MKFIKNIFHIIKSIILLAFLACLVVFMVNNREAVVLHLAPMPFNIETRMFVVLLAIFLIGMLFGLLILSYARVGNSIRNFKNRLKFPMQNKDKKSS
jgi:hypothetical protein